MENYIVKSGDTLSKIAKRFSLSLDDLLEVNPQMKDRNKIHPGQGINEFIFQNLTTNPRQQSI